MWLVPIIQLREKVVVGVTRQAFRIILPNDEEAGPEERDREQESDHVTGVDRRGARCESWGAHKMLGLDGMHTRCSDGMKG